MSRDVFLDNELSERSIHQQFRRLLKEARENGTAIGIGHPTRRPLPTWRRSCQGWMNMATRWRPSAASGP